MSNNFELLPDELVLKILSFAIDLPISNDDWPSIAGLSRVNSRFHRLVFDPSLWTHLQLYKLCRAPKALLSRCSFLRQLEMEYFFSADLIRFALKNCSHLKSLALIEYSTLFPLYEFMELMNECGQKIRQLTLYVEEIPEDFFEKGAEFLVRLKSLNVYCRRRDFGTGLFTTLADNSVNLESLDIKAVHIFLDVELMKKFFRLRGKQLKSLSLFNEGSFIGPMSFCERLERLELRLSQLDASVVKDISKLKTLRVIELKAPTGECLAELFENNKSLQKVEIKVAGPVDYLDRLLQVLGKNCPQLEDFCFYTSCPVLCDKGVEAVVSNCKKLRSLRLPRNCRITMESLAGLDESSTKLRDLTCEEIVGADLSELYDLAKRIDMRCLLVGKHTYTRKRSKEQFMMEKIIL